MDTLTSMRAFTRVVELGGFAAAARSLALSPAMVTKHIANLEARMGVRLLHRTTRRVGPTEAGRAYFERCVELLQGVEEAEAAAGEATQTPHGTLRLTAPVEFGNLHLAPLVGELIRAHPEIAVSLHLSNRVVDIVDEGFDAAVRVAPTMDSSLVARRIATSRLLVLAAPSYLSRHGRPKRPSDLGSHACLAFAVPAPMDKWRFARKGAVQAVKIAPRMLATSSEALRAAACDGTGITLLPTFLAAEDVRAGRLQPLFQDYDSGALGIHVVYPHRKYLSAKVRVLLELVRSRYGDDPLHDPWLS